MGTIKPLDYAVGLGRVRKQNSVDPNLLSGEILYIVTV